MLFELETQESDEREVNELMARGYLKCCQVDEAMNLLRSANIEMKEEHIIMFADAMLESGDLRAGYFFYQSLGRKIPAEKLILCGDRCLSIGNARLARKAYTMAVREG